jgi:hypothetical protein
VFKTKTFQNNQQIGGSMDLQKIKQIVSKVLKETLEIKKDVGVVDLMFLLKKYPEIFPQEIKTELKKVESKVVDYIYKLYKQEVL